jgi:hypothetical protein
VLIESVQDLDPLALTDRQLPHMGVRVDREAIALAELAHLLLDGRRIDAKRPAGAADVAEHQVLRDREALDEAKCWCTMQTRASIASRGDAKSTFSPCRKISPSSGR